MAEHAWPDNLIRDGDWNALLADDAAILGPGAGPWSRLLLVAVLLVVSRAVDLGFTYLYTPDLLAELNPIVSLSGLGWWALLGIQVPFIGAALMLAFYYETDPHRFLPDHGGLSLRELRSHLFRRGACTTTTTVRRWPDESRIRLFQLGHVLPRAMILNGFVLGLWACLAWRFEPTHGGLLLALHPLIVVAAYVAPVVLFQMRFMRRQHELYSRSRAAVAA